MRGARATFWAALMVIEAAVWHPVYMNSRAPEWLQYHGYRLCNWIAIRYFYATSGKGP